MSHFAEIDKNGIVLRVIVAEQDFVDSMKGNWIQTSYNVRGGEYTRGEDNAEKLVFSAEGTKQDILARSRKNYAGVGFKYDGNRDVFIPPQPYPSWILNENTCQWEAPVKQPDGRYRWDESSLSWVEIK